MSGGVGDCADRERKLKDKRKADKYKKDKAQWEHDKRVLQAKIGQCDIKKAQLLEVYMENERRFYD